MTSAIALGLLLTVTATVDPPEIPASEGWPTIESIDLELRLHQPPAFEASATLALAGVRTREIPILLNRSLFLVSARIEGGVPLLWSEGGPAPSKYHREGRVVRLDLGRKPDPAGERVRIALEWSGRAADGSGKQDWRGILLLAPEEFRMSEQTVFYPQVPADLEGPGVEPVRGSVRVIAPRDFEVYVSGVPVGAPVPAPPGGRSWAFEIATPSTLSVVAGRYRRHERRSGKTLLVALLKEEHAALGPRVLDDVARAHDFYVERFGSVDSAVLGVCEIDCIMGSYNWAAPGLLTFDRDAFGEEGLPSETIGHEVAHLWWGGAVEARGPGERFLTEGLAEHSSWRWLEAREGEAAARRHAAEQRNRYLAAVHEAGADPGLAQVVFGTKGYQGLAYAKSALVLRGLEAAVGRDALDRALAAYHRRCAGKGSELPEFLECLEGAGKEAREVLPWILREGHAHLAFKDVRVDGTEQKISGVLESRPCPKGIPSLLPARVPIRLTTEKEEVDLDVLLGDRGDFKLDTGDSPVALAVDPEATVPIADPPVHVLRPVRLARSDPPDGARDAPYLLERIRLVFDGPLAPIGPGAHEELGGPVTERAKAAGADSPWLGGVSLEEDGRALVLSLKNPLSPDREILVDLDGVLLDARGVPIPEAKVRFRTVASADSEQPQVVRSEPAAGATEVDPGLKQIRIVFSEPMRPGRGYSGTEVAENEKKGLLFPLVGRSPSRWEEGGTVLVYDLSGPLRPGATYLLPLRHLFRDLAGNTLVHYELRFSTRP
ncbi:MAG: Ig-like domain-containing protein [Planctomycetes bacterium]|nr:Ig-like domain-containing protein [Planctomycetota bacterium]